jgi:hypothetical protein
METKQLVAQRHRWAILAGLPGFHCLARIETLSVDTMLKCSAIFQARNSTRLRAMGSQVSQVPLTYGSSYTGL